MTDPSEPLKNAKHEAFALAWAGRLSFAECYRRSGYSGKDPHSKGSRMALNGHIKARRTWLQRQSASSATLTLREKRELLAAIARGGKDQDRIAAMKLDNDLSGEGAEAGLQITITRAWAPT